MTINPLTRWRPRTAILTIAATTALGLAAIQAVASTAPASAALSGPRVYEQQALNKNIPIATGNVHTIVVKSPVLAPGSYLVNLVLDLANLPPGANVLCGDSTTLPGDIVSGNYGEFNTITDGTCAVTGTITINNTNDRALAWATVYSGPGGATVSGFSMNEQPVGSVTLTH